jgi:WD40 repeat protein/tetratricopeptide (TPR) repeat protein
VLFGVAQAERATEQSRAHADLTSAYGDLNDQKQQTQEALDKSERLAGDLAQSLNKSEKLAGDLAVSLNKQQRQSARLALERGQSLIAQQDPAGLLWLARALELVPEDARDLERVIRLNLADMSCEVPLVRSILPHADTVSSAVFSPDAKTVLTTSQDGMARMWDVATGQLLGMPLQHGVKKIHQVLFSPDGKTVLTRHDANSIRLLDVATGEPVALAFQQLQGVRVAAFSPDGKTLLTGSTDKTAQLWEVATGKAIGPALLHTGSVDQVAFSPDGKTMATGSNDGVRLWEVATSKAIGQVLKHNSQSYGFTFSPDSKRLLTSVWGENARLWDADTVKLLWQQPDGGPVVAFSPDGKRIVTATRNGQSGSPNEARLRDAATGQPIGERMMHPKPVTVVMFSPDSRMVLTGSGGAGRLWDADTGKPLGEPLRHQQPISFSPDGTSILTASAKTAQIWDLSQGRQMRAPLPHPVDSVVPSMSRADGRILAVAGSNPEQGALRRAGEVVLWDLATGQPLGPPLTFPRQVIVLFSPDGKAILTTKPVGRGSEEGYEARLWDVASGKPLSPPLLHEDWIMGRNFSSDGKLFATGAGDGAARIWEVPTGKLHCPPLRHESRVYGVTFTPDSEKLLTTGYTGIAQFWDVATGKPSTPQVTDLGMTQSYLSPDGKTFLIRALYGTTAQLYDAATGKAIGPTLPHLGTIRAANFSRDSRLVVTGSEDGMARLWETATGKPFGLPLVHQSIVIQAGFSPDSTILVTASEDKTVRLWDVQTGMPLGAPLWHSGPVHAALSADGKTLVTGSSDRAVRFWKVPAPVEGDVPRVVRWVEVVTGMELSPEGVVNYLDGPTWQQRRQSLVKLGGPVMVADPLSAADPDWAYHKAVECVHGGYWPAALALLDRQIKSQPGAWLAHVLRTRVHLQLGEHEKAATDLTQAFAQGPRQQVYAWYRIQLAECTGDLQWDRALWYLDQLIAQQPGDWVLHDRRARAQVERGAWDKVEADYVRAQELGPDSSFYTHWGHVYAQRGQWEEAEANFARALALGDLDTRLGKALALVRLQLGDTKGYRETCAGLLKRLSQDDSYLVVRRVVWTCWLSPAMGVEGAQQAEKALKANMALENRTEDNLGLFLVGVGHYRSDRFEEAMKPLDKASSKTGGSAYSSTVTCYFLAMAHHRLGHAAEARKWLDRAVEQTESAIKNHPASPSHPSQWGDYVQFQLLRREAEALIEGKTGEPKE